VGDFAVISSFLSRLFSWVRSRGLWITIGIIALILLIWYAGPLFAFGTIRPLESVAARCWLIGLILGYFLLRFLWRRWRASRMNDRLANMLRSTLSAAPAENPGDVAKLRERFDEALGILRKARFEQSKPSLIGRLLRHGKYVYELPWYVIIGAPGAGKTTALLNSGLSFPLAKQFGKAALRGAGGTRHCDWWFTNEAVFIDTAGRYTTHESDAEADKAEWLGFLSLLKKNRARQPINGVLVTLSVSDLMELSREDRLAHAATLRRRLDELRNDLGVSFPVYVLINKCDLLLGFDEYFAALDRAGREQVWGVTLPLSASGNYDPDPERISGELKLLEARIADGLVDTLQGEPDLNRRSLIYSFPQQFGVLTHIVNETIAELVAPSRYSSSPLLRGIYFSSGTQEGTPFDRVLSALGQGFQTKRPQRLISQGNGKTFFLHELLTKVVFAEAHIAGANRRADRRSRALHIGAYLLCAAVLCGAVLSWIISYRNNLTYIAEVERKTEIFRGELDNLPTVNNSNINTLLPVLTMAEGLPDGSNFKVGHPLLRWTFGLYQGEKLGAASNPLYQRLLIERFAPTLKASFEQWLRIVDVEDMEFAYEILKTYVMMYEPQHFNADDFVTFVLAIWGHDLPEGALMEEREALARHVRALVELDAVMPSVPIDMGLVQATRSRLSQYSSSQRIYHRLVRLLENNQLPPFSAAAEVGAQASQVFRRKSGRSLTSGVPSLYTYRGYHELFQNELNRVLTSIGRDESWVLGVSDSGLQNIAQKLASGELALEVKRHYMTDYVARWENYLDDIAIVEPASLSEAMVLARMLSGTDSPLMRFMQGVVRETTLLKEDNSKGSDRSMFDRVKRSVDATTQDIKRIVPTSVAGRLSPREIPELFVNNRFAELRKAVNGGDASASPLMASIKAFEELYMLLAAAESARVNGTPLPKSDLPTRLRAEAARLPEPGRGLFEAMAANSGKLIARQERQVKSDELTGTVTKICRETIEGRYPLARHAQQEVGLDDFTQMFGPGGRLDGYFQRELSSATDTSSSPWKLRVGVQGGLGGSASLGEFEKASVIKDVFFRGGAGTPQVTMTLKPLVMDATITTLTMDIDGQIVRYQHGPQVAYTISWPGTKGSKQVRVSLEPPLPQGVSGVTKEGPWALYRLFDEAEIQNGPSPERFNVILNVGGRRATFEVVASSVKNPFRLAELQSFRCPAGI